LAILVLAVFGLIVQTDRITDANNRYTDATTISISNKYYVSTVMLCVRHYAVLSCVPETTTVNICTG